MGMESPDPLGSNLKPHLNILLTFQIILRDLDLIRGQEDHVGRRQIRC